MNASRCCFSSLFCLSLPPFSLSPPKEKNNSVALSLDSAQPGLFCFFESQCHLGPFQEKSILIQSWIESCLFPSTVRSITLTRTHIQSDAFFKQPPKKTQKVPLGNLEIGRSKSEKDEKERELKKRRMNLKRHKNNFKSGRCRTKTQVVKETTEGGM